MRPEELHLLGDDGDAAAQLGGPCVAQVDAADPDRAVGDIPEPQQQAADGRLAASRSPDDPEDRARLEVQVDVVQDRTTFVVGERDVVEVDATTVRAESAPLGRRRCVAWWRATCDARRAPASAFWKSRICSAMSSSGSRTI